MTREISNSRDVIDSRDVIARIEELRGMDERDDDESQELKVLEALAEEAEGYAADWQYGETLIRESYFVAYCQELVQDIGDLPKDIPAYLVIDWEKTAENLKADYTEVDFDGVTYFIR
jgi:hypothetical protein